MESSFWHQRWEKNEIGFHNKTANSLLIKYFNYLDLTEGKRIFVPLCGKSKDIIWLAEKGHKVVGIELSKIAVDQFFNEHNLAPTISSMGTLIVYSTENITIFIGNIFDLSKEKLGPIDAIYDRAALVALPEIMRAQYTAHVIEITNHAKQLLISFEYDQSKLPGPPFSISDSLLASYYQSTYELVILASLDVEGGLKGKCQAYEKVLLLQPKGKPQD